MRRTLRFLLQKEFRQIFRDKAILRMMFMMPVIQLMILPWAADYEIKNIKLAVVDQDHSSYSRKLVDKITAPGYFQLTAYDNAYANAMRQVELDEADLVLEIPVDFEKDLVRDNKATLFMALNAINGVKANLGGAYLGTIIRQFNAQVRTEWVQYPRFSPIPRVQVESSNWYNPLMNYKYFMVPGILVILLTIIGSNLAALNIIREKEIGTIEQINVTPIPKSIFILGKLLPFWLLGMIVLTLGLFIAWAVYGIVPLGSFFTIYLFAALYLLAVLGMGLLISTVAATQQQAMLISFFLMMIFILLSGLYTSIDSMPEWAKWVTRFNPVTYFIEVMRRVVLKGATISDILPQIGIMTLFAVVLNTWAVLSYRKRS